MTKLNSRAARWRRRVLAIGGLGAVLTLARGTDPVRALHDPEDIGIGLINPTDGNPAPTATTELRVNTDTPGFLVNQELNKKGPSISAFGGGSNNVFAAGPAIRGQGGDSSGGGAGGTGVNGQGGDLTGGLGPFQVGGSGVAGEGGKGATFGNGGTGVGGVGGNSTTAPGTGVLGLGGPPLAAIPGGIGVGGIGGLTGGAIMSGPGVVGTSQLNHGVAGSSVDGIGTRGQSTNNFGMLGISSTAVGIRGIAFGASGAGVEGVASGSGPGVWGFTSAGHAVLGNSITGNGGVFVGATGVTATGPINAVVANGNVFCTGTGHFGGGLIIATRSADGGLRATHAITSPGAMVEDVGRARLVGGQARVEFDPEFVRLVGASDYAVFLTPAADSNGLFVASRSVTGFEVREQRGGASTLDFDYRVVAKRANSSARFAAVREPEPLTLPEVPSLPRSVSELGPDLGVELFERYVATRHSSVNRNGSSAGGTPSSQPPPRR